MSPSGPFHGLDEAALRRLAPSGAVVEFAKGERIVAEGEDGDSLYVVLSGTAKAYVADEAGNEVVLSTIPAGDYFGEVTLDGSPRSASVAALEPASCFVIPRADFEGLIEGNPAFARDLIRKLAGRVRTLTERVFDLALRDVYERFAKFAEERAVDYGELRIVPDRFTQREIAARIGGSREMVSRILKDLSTGGYVRVEDKRVVLLKKLPQKW